MMPLIDWLVTIATTIYTYLLTDITDDKVVLYMAYAFSLLCVLALVIFSLSLVPLLFKSITALFRRSTK